MTAQPQPVPKHNPAVPCPVTEPTLLSRSAWPRYCSLVKDPPPPAAASCSLRSESPQSLSRPRVSSKALPHTFSVIVLSQSLPRALRGQSPFAFTAPGWHTPRKQLHLGYSPLAVTASGSQQPRNPSSHTPLAVTDPLFSQSPRGPSHTVCPLRQPQGDAHTGSSPAAHAPGPQSRRLSPRCRVTDKGS